MHPVKLIYNGKHWELEWFGRQPYDTDTFGMQLTTNGQDYLAGVLKGLAERNPPAALAFMKVITDGKYVTPMAESLEFEGRMRAYVQYRPTATARDASGTVACGGFGAHDVLLAHHSGRINGISMSNETYRPGQMINYQGPLDRLTELEIPVGHSLLKALFVEAPRLRVAGGSGIDTRPVSIQQLLDLGTAKHS